VKVINLLGGPGTGKSTTAAGTFAELKHRGRLKAELITEYAKELCYEKSPLITNQRAILDEQYRRQARLVGQVDVAITDGPLIFGLVYADRHARISYLNDVVDRFDEFDNLNVFLRRVKPYAKYGRLQDEAEARELDVKIQQLPLSIHHVIDADRNAAVKIADIIESMI